MRDQIQRANDATYEAWCAHDPDGVAAVFAAGAVAYDVGSPEPLRGRDAIRERSWFDAEGLVVKDIHHWDVPSLLTQLGVLAAE